MGSLIWLMHVCVKRCESVKMSASSGWDLTLETVVEFSSTAEKQIDSCAESSISSEVQGSESNLLLCPHTTHELWKKKNMVFIPEQLPTSCDYRCILELSQVCDSYVRSHSFCCSVKRQLALHVFAKEKKGGLNSSEGVSVLQGTNEFMEVKNSISIYAKINVLFTFFLTQLADFVFSLH